MSFIRKSRMPKPGHNLEMPSSQPEVDLEANQGRFETSEANENHHFQCRTSIPTVCLRVYHWAKENGTDFMVMGFLGTICLALNGRRPAAHRLFPIATVDGEVIYPEFSYPHQRFIIPIWLGGFLPLFVPTVVFLLMQYRVRSPQDLNNAIIGLLYSAVMSTLFQIVLKTLVGGLRPHFLSVCKPDLSLESPVGFGTMYSRKVCTGDSKEINFAMTSFPSGHTTTAFAGLVYLSLYLKAKLRVWTNHRTPTWKPFVVALPILGATLIGCAVMVDYNHNWYDVVAGAIIGTVTAISAWRALWVGALPARWSE